MKTNISHLPVNPLPRSDSETQRGRVSDVNLSHQAQGNYRMTAPKAPD